MPFTLVLGSGIQTPDVTWLEGLEGLAIKLWVRANGYCSGSAGGTMCGCLSHQCRIVDIWMSYEWLLICAVKCFNWSYRLEKVLYKRLTGDPLWTKWANELSLLSFNLMKIKSDLVVYATMSSTVILENTCGGKLSVSTLIWCSRYKTWRCHGEGRWSAIVQRSWSGFILSSHTSATESFWNRWLNH